MEFRLLAGPMELSVAGRRVELGPPKQRTVLAALLVDAGRPVPVDTLVERVWDGSPPVEARNTLYAHVTRIRRVLARATEVGDGRVPRLDRSGAGYRLAVEPGRVDWHRFRDLVRQSRDAGDQQRAVLLREALELWRGTPLGDLSGGWVARVRESWRQQHLDAVLALTRTELRLGHAELVTDRVRELLAEHPLSEPLAAVMMAALRATGQVAEALDCYAGIRQRLAEQLGTDPGPELQQLHRTILRGEGAPRPAGGGTGGAGAVPAQLPADIRAFTGRASELARLDSLLAAGERRPAAVVISAVAGTAGVGKTALAVHWAHRVAHRFPAGQLYVNLRGYDPDQPMGAGEALAQLLAAIGVTGAELPAELDARAARYRSELAGRRMLIVLDNASSVEQVRPLLPGTGPCAVLVTSRDSLAGLVAVHGAQRLDLDLLPRADAVAVLHRLIGPRVEGEPDAAEMLAEQCARLPLALRIAAELAASRPAASLSDLVRELADQQSRLDLLDAGGDPRADVSAVFSWSIRQLPAQAARLYRLLGLHPGRDFDVYAAAALAGGALGPVGRDLRLLTGAHLVQVNADGRYTLHDLLRAYAARLAATDDAAQRQAALARLFDYYLATAAAAMDMLHPAEAYRRPRLAPAATPQPALDDEAAALAWLDTERATLAAIAPHGSARQTMRLSTTLARYLNGGHYTEALAIHSRAHNAAVATGDQQATAVALFHLGVIHQRLGRYALATNHLEQAMALYTEAGDSAGQADTLNNLGATKYLCGRYEEASDHYWEAVAIFRSTGDLAGEIRVLNNLGVLENVRGRNEAAKAHYQRCLEVSRLLGDVDGEALALGNLGDVELGLDRPDLAVEYLQEALGLYRRLGNPRYVGQALDSLGIAHTRMGKPEQGADYHRQALEIFRECLDGEGVPWAHNGLGEATSGAGRPADALAHHTDALATADEIGARDQQARAHSGLGRAYQALGDTGRATQHYRYALEIYTDLDLPEATDVQAALARLG